MATVFPRFKDQILYHRTFIPGKLQPYFRGRSQLWRSLRTSNRELAVIRSAQWTVRMNRLFLTLKRHGDIMTTDEREALVAHWLEVELDSAEDARTLGGPYSDQYLEDVDDILAGEREDAAEALTANNWNKMAKEADALIQSAGLPALDHAGEDFARLCRRLLVAKMYYWKIEQDRWEGTYTSSQRQPGAPTTTQATKTAAPSKASMPFSIRPHRRFPVHFAVTYNAGPFQGQGTIWNLSCTGWRLSGDLPMRPGEILSLTVTLPNGQRIDVPEVVVR